MASVTKRQGQVLDLLVTGRPNKLIAADLGITEQCVKAHVSKLFAKYHVENRVALTHVVDGEMEDLPPLRAQSTHDLAQLVDTLEDLLAAVRRLQLGGRP